MNLNYLEETIRTSKYLVCLAGMEGIMLKKRLHMTASFRILLFTISQNLFNLRNCLLLFS